MWLNTMISLVVHIQCLGTIKSNSIHQTLLQLFRRRGWPVILDWFNFGTTDWTTSYGLASGCNVISSAAAIVTCILLPLYYVIVAIPYFGCTRCMYFVGPWPPFIIGLPYDHPHSSGNITSNLPIKTLIARWWPTNVCNIILCCVCNISCCHIST